MVLHKMFNLLVVCLLSRVICNLISIGHGYNGLQIKDRMKHLWKIFPVSTLLTSADINWSRRSVLGRAFCYLCRKISGYIRSKHGNW